MNVDTFSLASEVTGTFYGHVTKGMKIKGQTSGAEATISDVRMISDSIGNLICSFNIPNPNVEANPRWETGTKTLRMTTSAVNSEIGGTVTGPISENTSFRLSATSHKRDGYTKNLELGTEINDRDRYAIRAQLLSELTDNLTVRIIVDKDEAEEVCCTTAALLNGAVTVAADALLAPGKTTIINPTNTYGYQTYLNFDTAGTIENQGISLHVDYDLGFANLKSISAYRESDQAVNGDVDFSSMPLLTNGIYD